ncbi:MAG: translation initiation factor IF-3 [Bacilli bacterium]|nr:translation initiation factor IF-3 [Bacilli bacterium]
MFINEQIRAKEVMVIGPNGEQLGVKSIKDANTLASYAGFDLVLINPNGNPPVCKVMDYNKFKYENKKKNKENIKKQRSANLELKEYRLSVSIDIHDFDTRVRNSSKYLEKGHKVKASIRFKGREMAHTELGKDVLVRFAEALKDVSEIEQKPTLDGRNMTMILMPKREK